MIKHYSPFVEVGTPQIVLVDHEQRFVDKTAAALTVEGFSCRGYTSIEAAAAAVRVRRPDLLLIAINVPGTSGTEISRRVRSDRDLANVPIIFMSATQIPDIIHRWDDGHGSYCVRTALDIGVLVELMEKMLPTAAVSQAAY